MAAEVDGSGGGWQRRWVVAEWVVVEVTWRDAGVQCACDTHAAARGVWQHPRLRGHYAMCGVRCPRRVHAPAFGCCRRSFLKIPWHTTASLQGLMVPSSRREWHEWVDQARSPPYDWGVGRGCQYFGEGRTEGNSHELLTCEPPVEFSTSRWEYSGPNLDD